jgi:serine/threonine-protein kinase
LLAVPFDLTRLDVTGGAVGIVPDVMQAAYVAGQPNDSGAMQASVSRTGTLVYATGGVQPPTDYDVMSVDRTGSAERLPIPPQDFRQLRLSPDGGRLALSTVGRERGVWVYAFDRGTLSRLTGAGRSTTPTWTPDGGRIAFSASANGPNNVYWIPADGSGKPELLVASARNLETAGWAPDGRDLLYYEIPDAAAAPAGTTLWVQDVAGQGAPRAVAEALANAGGADVSPDGRWVAYHSTDAGVSQVYVEAYPGPGPRFQVSTDGGGSPIWRGDGRELFYARSRTLPARGGAGLNAGAADVEIMVVEVTTQPTLTFGRPRPLFAGRYSMNGPARGYDVSRDGQRFLLLQARERRPDVISEMHVVQNWMAELR